MFLQNSDPFVPLTGRKDDLGSFPTVSPLPQSVFGCGAKSVNHSTTIIKKKLTDFARAEGVIERRAKGCSGESTAFCNLFYNVKSNSSVIVSCSCRRGRRSQSRNASPTGVLLEVFRSIEKKKRETKKTNICADSVKPVISRADDGQDRLARQVRTQFQQPMMIMLFK